MSAQAATLQILDDERIVYVVDDDRDVRVALSMLLQTAGVHARPFASADDFLAELADLKPGCLVVDIRMPRKDGLSLLEELNDRGIRWPTIMITGHGDIGIAVRAMKLGAREFLEKPFEHIALLDALERGFLDQSKTARKEGKRVGVQARIARLTPRQRQVLKGLSDGNTNKQIAAALNLSCRTVEMHRAAMARCLGVASTGELIGLITLAGGTD
jgi:two-component system response regulator FixJ